MTWALVAIALSPLAYWVLGPEHGARAGGSSPAFRWAIVGAYFAALALAVLEELG